MLSGAGYEKHVPSPPSDLHSARNTVRRYVRADSFPEAAKRGPCGGQLTPFKDYLKRRFHAGHTNAVLLWREIRARGCPGSDATVRRFISHQPCNMIDYAYDHDTVMRSATKLKVDKPMSERSFIFRGALGGVLGAFIKILLLGIFYTINTDADGGYKPLVVIVPALGIPWAVLTGAMIGYILVKINRYKKIWPFAGAVVGGGILAAIGVLGYSLGVRRVALENIVGLSIFSLFFPDFGLISGTLAGLLTGYKLQSKSGIR